MVKSRFAVLTITALATMVFLAGCASAPKNYTAQTPKPERMKPSNRNEFNEKEFKEAVNTVTDGAYKWTYNPDFPEDVVFGMFKNGSEEWVVGLIGIPGLAIDARDEDGSTFLHHAAWHGWERATEALLKLKADPSAKRSDAYTPLHWAAYTGNEKIIGMLANAGVDLNAAAATGATPLHLATWKNHTEAVLALFEYGARVDAKKADGSAG
jgi:hypothetical protein